MRIRRSKNRPDPSKSLFDVIFDNRYDAVSETMDELKLHGLDTEKGRAAQGWLQVSLAILQMQSAEQVGRSIVRATWALVATTAALVVTTVALIIVTVRLA